MDAAAAAAVASAAAKVKPVEGVVIPMWEVDGIYLPLIFAAKVCNQPQHIREMSEKLQMRNGDIMVLAYPKAGTHWTWEIVTMLTSGKAEYHSQSKCFSMLEATPHKDIESQSTPRVLNSHLPLRLLPQQQINDKKVKLIHVYRNVRDVFISAYYHYLQIPGSQDMALEDLEKLFFSGKVPFGSYFTYLIEMDEYRKNNPDVPFLSLSFEDMTEDPRKAIEVIANFLEVKADPQLIEEVVQATRFSKLKEANQGKEQVPLVSQCSIFRKGEVGDWKNHLSAEQVKRFDEAMLQLQSCDYNFRYEL